MSRNRIETRRCLGSAVVACVLMALAVASGTAWAQRSNEGGAALDLHAPDAEAHVVQGSPVSLDEAVALARERFEGRVVRAETQTINGREVHVIRILDSNGRVRNVRIDAATGRIRQ